MVLVWRAVARTALGLGLGLAGLGGVAGDAQAATYTFPGALPVGCSGSGANYSCGALALASGDVVNIDAPIPASITVNGALSVGDAQINPSGSAANLNLLVSGALTVGAAGVVRANVTAATVTSTAGGANFGGNVSTTTGQIHLTDRTLVSGNVSSDSGIIFVDNEARIGGSISSAAAITVGIYTYVAGNVTGTAGGAVTVGANATVIGSISTGGAVTVGADAIVDDVTSTGGAVTVGARASVTGDVRSHGAVTVGANAGVSGTVLSSTGAVTLGAGSTTNGPVTGYGAVTVGAGTVVGGTVSSNTGAITLGAGSSVPSVCCGSPCTNLCATSADGSPLPPTPSTGPHHVEIRHGTGVGLTCSPATLSVVACANAACTSTYTGGLSGTLTASGAGANANWVGGSAFSLASGVSSTIKQLQLTSVGSVTLGLSGVAPAATSATTCNFGTPACSFSAADAGFLFNVANHAAEASQSVAVSAVRKSDSSALCVPAFGSVSKDVNFACAYQNPSSGTLAARLRGVALNVANAPTAACDASGRAVTLDFNASGVASVALQYADVGQMQLTARYTGAAGSSEAGLVMTGSASFISAPASFGFSAVSAAPIKAGTPFAATLSALNSAAATTSNFGRESPASAATLTFARVQPTGTGAADGVFSGSLGAFTAGVATASNLVWSEVGRGDLSATLTGASYLGSGLSASGSTASGGGGAGAVGRFIPHHFEVVVTPACGTFSYAGQPFTVRVTALNGLTPPTPTVNYDASMATTPNFAQPVTLSAAPVLSVGALSGAALAASRFSAGVASAATPAFTFTNKLTAPQTLALRAIDADGVSSLGHAEGASVLRSGRLRVSNAFGAATAALALAVQAQYWGGNAWVMNSADSCSVLPAGAVALGNYLDYRGVATSAWSTSASAVTISGGQGTLTLSAPSPQSPVPTGSVDVALNLGSLTLDQSCLGAHPPSLGAGLAWLRSQNGSCASGWLTDPSARATFGIYGAEMLKSHDARDLD